jgi:hypothetical protein
MQRIISKSVDECVVEIVQKTKLDQIPTFVRCILFASDGINMDWFQQPQSVSISSLANNYQGVEEADFMENDYIIFQNIQIMRIPGI